MEENTSAPNKNKASQWWLKKIDKKEINDKISFTPDNTPNTETGLLNKKGKASKLTILITCENLNYQVIEIGTDLDINMYHWVEVDSHEK